MILYRPEIPQNTGNIARTCAATHIPLHLIEPLGFQLSDRHLKRAGLDYWPHVQLSIHSDYKTLRSEIPQSRWVYFSAHAHRFYYDFDFRPGDCLVFGSEAHGLPAEILQEGQERILQVPVDRTLVRSLNLATTVGIVLFEALRQFAFNHKESNLELIRRNSTES
ncbi:MAG: tRNA (cytidine(34)-2'-O)-methyltransferase [Desulforhabdus sp.]|nr:tRNA (cytidine(34)-2'-O)-methyltransferase [Desulforhabdus sp.]